MVSLVKVKSPPLSFPSPIPEFTLKLGKEKEMLKITTRLPGDATVYITDNPFWLIITTGGGLWQI
jgi:hypothetical protein